MTPTSGSRRRSTTFEALTSPLLSAMVMIFPHTSPTYQARAKDHAGSLANFGSFIHLGIGITPPDKKGGDKRTADLFKGTEVGPGKRDAPPRVECRDHTPAAAVVNCNRNRPVLRNNCVQF